MSKVFKFSDVILPKTLDPAYDSWLFCPLKKVPKEMKGLRSRFEALSHAEKVKYLLEVRAMKERSDANREIFEHPDSVEEYKHGPASVKIYRRGKETLVVTDCTVCDCCPCEHTGANFTDTGLMKGIFPGDENE